MEPPAPHILIVDDEEGFRFGAVVALRRGGYRVSEAGNGGEALEKILSARDAGDPVRLVVTDIRMPVMSGIELIDALRERGVDTAFCAITCFGDQTLVSELAGKGCTDYLEKPFSPDDLVRRLREILQGDSP
ncbi:MAG TPA: response regulator [Candidatus Deferrimicrobiaceae bacterium]